MSAECQDVNLGGQATNAIRGVAWLNDAPRPDLATMVGHGVRGR